VTAIAVNTPVSIVTQPTNVTVRATGSTTLRVVAQGSAPVTYEWTKDNQVLSGANTAELTFVNIKAGDAGQYIVKISNSKNSVTSNPVAVTVLNALDVSTGRYARLTLAGSTGHAYYIEYAEKVGSDGKFGWSNLTNFVLAPNPLSIVDPTSAAPTSRFYRAQEKLPAPPARSD